MKLNHLIIIGALCGALLLPSSASSWGVVGLGGGGEPEAKNIAYVGATGGMGNSSASTIAATAASHTAGNFLVVCVSSAYDSSATVQGIADTASNTYTHVVSSHRTDLLVEIWYARNITGNANNQVTATFTGASTYRRIAVIEYSGTFNASPIDSYDDANGTTATSWATDASSSTDSEALMVAAYSTYMPSQTFTAGTSSQQFTLRGGTITTDFQCEEAILSSSGSKSSSMSGTVGTNWAGAHAIFK